MQCTVQSKLGMQVHCIGDHEMRPPPFYSKVAFLSFLIPVLFLAFLQKCFPPSLKWEWHCWWPIHQTQIAHLTHIPSLQWNTSTQAVACHFSALLWTWGIACCQPAQRYSFSLTKTDSWKCLSAGWYKSVTMLFANVNIIGRQCKHIEKLYTKFLVNSSTK